jgi:hypothetical protein
MQNKFWFVFNENVLQLPIVRSAHYMIYVRIKLSAREVMLLLAFIFARLQSRENKFRLRQTRAPCLRNQLKCFYLKSRAL